MAAGTSQVTIDGSHGEGGGALLRVALTMSAMTLQPVEVTDIRGATLHPGIDPEDLTLMHALAESTGAEMAGITPGANHVKFAPTRTPKGLSGRLASFRNESNRGANALIVLNSLMPILAGAGVYCSVVCEGETFGTRALGYDAFAGMTLEVLKKLGLYAIPTLNKAAFGREARGEVALDVEPSYLDGLDWTSRGEFLGMFATVTTSNLPASVGHRALSHLQSLANQYKTTIDVECVDVPATGPGCNVTVSAMYERGMGGGSALGARGLRVEMLSQAAFREAASWMESNSCLDAYLADQIIVPCVFGHAPVRFSVSSITQRLLTSIWVIKQFIPLRITVKGSEGKPGVIEIQRS
ncbi:MAG TPA: RNA 3'-terminal phosphate cyclase [Fimbriimonas sp.]|nr:RNA 3'-terminal phosphate cyclase [Fimbriimonas sp.]